MPGSRVSQHEHVATHAKTANHRVTEDTEKTTIDLKFFVLSSVFSVCLWLVVYTSFRVVVCLASRGSLHNMASDLRLLLRKLRTNAKGVATVAPSSRALCRAILRGIDWSRTTCVVELGAGTGPITELLVKLAPPTCRLVVNEYDPDFCARLREKFPGLDVFEGDAAKIGEELASRGITQVDQFISGLPLSHFPAHLRTDVVNQCGGLMTSDSEFRQLTTAPWIYRRLYRQYFETVHFGLVPWNVPPGGVYYCSNWRGKQPTSRSSSP